MAEMAICIDVTKCTACRACQVACKSWNQLKAVKTVNRGTHENPPDLSADTWNRIIYNEKLKNGRIEWSFFNERCRHCEDPPCMYAAEDVPGAVIKDKTGAVIFTEKTKLLNFEDVRDACPFDIPRYDETTGRIYKCNLCIDRIKNGLRPACVTACSTGALNFGTKAAMLKLANERIREIGGDANLYPGEEYNTFWVLPEKEEYYGIAKAPDAIPRRFAWNKRFSPWATLGLAAGFLGYISKSGTGENQEKGRGA